jgi:serine protease AprX
MTRCANGPSRRTTRADRRRSRGVAAFLVPVATAVTVLALGTADAQAASKQTGPTQTGPTQTGSAFSTTAVVPALGYAPDDTGSTSAVTRILGAQSAWAAGWTGAGVDVAVIDTGITPVPGLDAAGKIVTGPDLSLDSQRSAVAGLDAFGHGTFMAGLIAGRDAGTPDSAVGCTTCLGASPYSDATRFVGMAPDARLVNVKIGAADGAADVTQVVAALDWVSQHAHDPGLNIKVVSLSYGTASGQSYDHDPLARAAERAWKRGVLVVAAAGNEGRSLASLANPAYDPHVLAVGGDDPRGTLSVSDDAVPTFAQHGTASRPVDVIAPATHLLGLRVPGSFIDSLTGNTGKVGTRFQRGSGTSQATALVSGLAALVAQRYPQATPDQLKALIRDTATPLPLINDTPAQAAAAKRLGLSTSQYLSIVNSINGQYSGKGVANAARGVTDSLPSATASAQTAAASTGDGTLDKARGGVYLTDGALALTGDRDLFGHAYSATSGSTAAGASGLSATPWSGGVWNSGRWTGDGWNGLHWGTTTWTGATWAGRPWSSLTSSAMTWDGARWTGSGWDGCRWTGSSWDGARWSGSTWS